MSRTPDDEATRHHGRRRHDRPSERGAPVLTADEYARKAGMSVDALRSTLGLAEPERVEATPAVTWVDDELRYSQRAAQWGSARWLANVRDAARRVSAHHQQGLKLVCTSGTPKSTAAGQYPDPVMEQLLRAQDVLQAPSLEAAIHAALAAGVIAPPKPLQMPVLTPQLLASLLCLAAGVSPTETALLLGLRRDAERHVRAMLCRALGATNELQAVVHGWSAGFLHHRTRLPRISELRDSALQQTPITPVGPPASVHVMAYALILNPDHDVLMVRPRPLPGRRARMRLPGGATTSTESPPDVAERAAQDEVSLTVKAGRVLAQEWIALPETETTTFALVFDCSTVATSDPALVPLLSRQPTAPEEFRWVSHNALERECLPQQARRIRAALRAQKEGPVAELHVGGLARLQQL